MNQRRAIFGLRQGLCALLCVGLWGGATAAPVLPPPVVEARADLPCLECGGTGRVERAVSGIKTANLNSNISSLLGPCTVCFGAKHLVRALTYDERLTKQRAQRRAFDNEQLANGLVPIASAYIDRETLSKLSPEEHARFCHLYPRACQVCQGLGVIACKDCRGKGYTLVREKVIELEAHYKREQKATYHEVKRACKTCVGTGMLPCKKCAGDGLAALCSRCNGTGLQEKRGKKDAPAELIRCASCNGEGRK